MAIRSGASVLFLSCPSPYDVVSECISIIMQLLLVFSMSSDAIARMITTIDNIVFFARAGDTLGTQDSNNSNRPRLIDTRIFYTRILHPHKNTNTAGREKFHSQS